FAFLLIKVLTVSLVQCAIRLAHIEQISRRKQVRILRLQYERIDTSPLRNILLVSLGEFDPLPFSGEGDISSVLRPVLRIKEETPNMKTKRGFFYKVKVVRHMLKKTGQTSPLILLL